MRPPHDPACELLRLAEARERLRKAPQLLEDGAAIVVGLGHFGADRERPVAARKRLLEAV